ncbi:hypothetical protein [Amycolatopsis sp. NPDC051903]|uniref:hypothetical protein n=1 Tax=Amycolatopsis sp. NPDC051903 TaxID=3363936 RepID=UPI0037BABCE0
MVVYALAGSLGGSALASTCPAGTSVLFAGTSYRESPGGLADGEDAAGGEVETVPLGVPESPPEPGGVVGPPQAMTMTRAETAPTNFVKFRMPLRRNACCTALHESMNRTPHQRQSA